MNHPSPQLLSRYLSGQCTADEKQQVKRWYASFDDQNALGDVFPETNDPAYQQALFQRVEAVIRQQEPLVVPLQSTRRQWLWAVAATVATVVLVVGALSLWKRTDAPVSERVLKTKEQPYKRLITFTNRQPKVVAHQLPDGSMVWLNPRATLSYPKQFVGTTRSVVFVGEGFFEVSHDATHPFIIQSGPLTTQVLGTSFNVRALPGVRHYEVAVVTGKVAVNMKSANNPIQQVIVTPRQRAISTASNPTLQTLTDKSTLKRAPYEPTSIAFNWVTLDEVARRLEQVYSVDIQFANPALKQCRIQADFTNERLPVILELLSRSTSTTYTLDGSLVVLSGPGCNDS